jgi:hypothetical protein
MMPSPQTEAAPRPPPPASAPRRNDPDTVPLNTFGPIDEDDHILVLGGHGPEMMCALLRAGATNVTHLRAHERPEAGSASLVIVPRVPSLDWLATALASIRRALTSDGRLVIHAGRLTTTATEIRRMLTLHGMVSIHAKSGPDGQVFTAEPRPYRVD